MKKAFCVLLILCLALAAPPAYAAADVRVVFQNDTAAVSGTGAVFENGVLTITASGRYELSGALTGSVCVSARKDAQVELVLDSVSITNPGGAAIDAQKVGLVTLTLPAGTQNTLTGASQDAAVYVKGDLIIDGEGSLFVSDSVNNGLQAKGTFTLLSGAVSVQAANNGVRAGIAAVLSGGALDVTACGDGVQAVSGDIGVRGGTHRVISTGANGLKTGDAETDGGSVLLSGGTLRVYAACDGVDAAENIELSENADLSVWTESHSEYSGAIRTGDAPEETEFTFKINQSLYDESFQYAAYFQKTSEPASGVWRDVTFSRVGSQNNYYTLTAPAGYDSVSFYEYAAGQKTRSLTAHQAAATDVRLEAAYTTYVVSGRADGVLTGDWSAAAGGMNGMGQGKSWEYSCKGLKAGGSVLILGGTLTVDSADDAVHAASITFSGGVSTLSSEDDGAHADGVLTISGGEVTVLSSYEGLEGVTVAIEDGVVKVDAQDDGINAGALLTVSGGSVDVSVPNGDTDGIDSNNAVAVTGGMLLVRSGATGMMAGTFDTGWGGVTANGGTIAAVGGIAEVPGAGSANGLVIFWNQSVPAGRYALFGDAGEICSFTVSSDYSSMWLSSDDIVVGGVYTLYKDDIAYKSWTQTELNIYA